MLFNGMLVTVRGDNSDNVYIRNNFVSELIPQLSYYLVKTYRRSAVQIPISSSQYVVIRIDNLLKFKVMESVCM